MEYAGSGEAEQGKGQEPRTANQEHKANKAKRKLNWSRGGL